MKISILQKGFWNSSITYRYCLLRFKVLQFQFFERFHNTYPVICKLIIRNQNRSKQYRNADVQISQRNEKDFNAQFSHKQFKREKNPIWSRKLKQTSTHKCIMTKKLGRTLIFSCISFQRCTMQFCRSRPDKSVQNKKKNQKRHVCENWFFNNGLELQIFHIPILTMQFSMRKK